METKTFFRKVSQLREDVEKQIMIITQQDDNIITSSESILLQIDESIRELKKMVKDFIFESIADEVHFFKEHKPYFISRYIYYSKILEINTSKPMAGDKALKKFYEEELLKLKDYYAKQLDFYNYYHRRATYLDHKYFIRKSYDLTMKLSSGLYNLDEDFTTTHDHKVAVILANELLEEYMIKSLHSIGLDRDLNRDQIPRLIWSSSKVSLIELMYALHQTNCFNGGNIDFSEVIRFAEKCFDTDLGNFYKTIGEIKNRKYAKTKFLQLLTENLDKALLEEKDD